MSAIVLEHVKATELPSLWAEKLHAKPEDTFKIVIETEHVHASEAASVPNAAFGIWRDREDMGSIDDHIRNLRRPRY